MDDRIMIYKSSKKGMMIVFGSLILALAGWLFLKYTGNEIAGWSFLIFAAFCLIFGAGTLFDRKPYIILSPAGVTDVHGIQEEIEWDAILGVDEFYYWGQYFIRILVGRNYKPSLIRPTWFYRFDRLYERKGLKGMFIRVAFLEVNSMKLASFMRKMVEAEVPDRFRLLNEFRAEMKKRT